MTRFRNPFSQTKACSAITATKPILNYLNRRSFSTHVRDLHPIPLSSMNKNVCPAAHPAGSHICHKSFYALFDSFRSAQLSPASKAQEPAELGILPRILLAFILLPAKPSVNRRPTNFPNFNSGKTASIPEQWKYIALNALVKNVSPPKIWSIGGNSIARKGADIYKQKDGRWEGRYVSGHDCNGKSRYSTLYIIAINPVAELSFIRQTAAKLKNCPDFSGQ